MFSYRPKLSIIAAILTLATFAGNFSAAAAEPPDSADATNPIKVGAKLPPLTLTALDGKTFDLTAAVASRPTVLVFYRGGWCPFCSRQLGQLNAAQVSLKELGYQVLAISPDRPEALKKTMGKNAVNYTLLSDSKMTACRALGIAFKVDDATYAKYQGYGVDLEQTSGEKHHLLPVPTVMVLGTDQVINFIYSNPNYQVRLHPDVLLAAARVALPAK